MLQQKHLALANKRPLIIGVTGGIASGKSTVARMISGPGILHADADHIVHELMQKDRFMIYELSRLVPSAKKLRYDGWANCISRGALADAVTANPDLLPKLEEIIHPYARAQEMAIIHAATRNRIRAVVLDVPLLFETDADQLCDVVLVAYAPLPHRRRRAFRRERMNEAKWQRLLDRQIKNHHRHPRADLVIHTHLGKASTRQQIRAFMHQFKLD